MINEEGAIDPEQFRMGRFAMRTVWRGVDRDHYLRFVGSGHNLQSRSRPFLRRLSLKEHRCELARMKN